MFILWLGWFGFNPGSTNVADGSIGRIAVTTNFAAATGALGALITSWLLLKKPASRVAIVALSIPVAVVVNGVRVFITGFLVAFVDPKLAEGFSHMTEGWLLFLVAFAILGAITWVVLAIEERAVSRATASVAHE